MDHLNSFRKGSVVPLVLSLLLGCSMAIEITDVTDLYQTPKELSSPVDSRFFSIPSSGIFDNIVVSTTCTAAVLNLVQELNSDWQCPTAIDSLYTFINDFQNPSFSFGNVLNGIDTDDLTLNLGVPDYTPDQIDTDKICGKVNCMAHVEDALETLDASCNYIDMLALPDWFTLTVRILKSFAKAICIADADGNNCLKNFISGFKNGTQAIFDGDFSNDRDVICSKCSLQIEQLIFSSANWEDKEISGIPFDTMLDLVCLRDRSEGWGDDASFCPINEILSGAAYATNPVLYSIGFPGQDICDSNCRMQAAFLLDTQDADAAWNCVNRRISGGERIGLPSVEMILNNVDNPSAEGLYAALVMDIAEALNVIKDRIEVEVPREIPGDGEDDGESDSNDGGGNGSTVTVNLIDIIENEAIPSNDEFARILSTSPLTNTNRVRTATNEPTSIFRLFVEQVAADVPSSTSVMRLSNMVMAFTVTVIAVFMM